MRLIKKPYMNSIRISNHAMEQIKTRLNIRHDKIPHFVEKAWHSTNPPTPRSNRKEYNSLIKYNRKNIVTRTMMGHTFLFGVGVNTVTLVTFI